MNVQKLAQLPFRDLRIYAVFWFHPRKLWLKSVAGTLHLTIRQIFSIFAAEGNQCATIKREGAVFRSRIQNTTRVFCRAEVL